MIDRDAEEALNLRGMQIDKQSAIGARSGEQVCHKLGADGNARLVFAVLARVAVIGNHDCDARGRCALQCVNHDEQLDQVLVDGIAGGLHDEHIDAADVFEQLEVDFAIGKTLQLGFAHRHADVAANRLSQRPIGSAREQLEALVLAQIAGALALRGAGLRVLRLGVWRYRRDSIP